MYSCSPSSWYDVTLTGKAAWPSGYEARGGGGTLQHSPSDLAKPPEAADVDCNDACAGLSFLGHNFLASDQHRHCYRSLATEDKNPRFWTWPLHCFCPTWLLLLNCYAAGYLLKRGLDYILPTVYHCILSKLWVYLEARHLIELTG